MPIMLLQFLFDDLSKFLGPILWAWSTTASGISTFASRNSDFTDFNALSLDSLLAECTPSMRRQRRLSYCSGSSLWTQLFIFNFQSSDNRCLSILLLDSICLHYLLTSFCISLLICILRSVRRLLKIAVMFSSC